MHQDPKTQARRMRPSAQLYSATLRPNGKAPDENTETEATGAGGELPL